MPSQKKTSKKLSSKTSSSKNKSPIKTQKASRSLSKERASAGSENPTVFTLNVKDNLDKYDGKILIHSPLENIVVKRNKDLEFEYYYKIGEEDKLLTKKYIDQGGFSRVYSLELKDASISKTVSHSFIVKELRGSKKNIKREIDILKKVINENVLCNIVKSRILEQDNNTFIFMEKYNGDVMKLLKTKLTKDDYLCSEMSAELKFNIFKHIVNDVVCLAEKGLFYIDMKLENILYKVLDIKPDKIKFKLSLGDVGSLCYEETKPCVRTYAPPEIAFTNKTKINDEFLKKDLVWSLGILLVQLLFLPNYRRGYKNTIESFIGDDQLRWPMFSDAEVLPEKETIEDIKYRLNYDIRRFYGQFNKDNELRGVRQYFTYKFNKKDEVSDLIEKMIVLEPAKRISLEDLAVELGVRAPQPQTPRKSRFTIRVVPQEEIITFKPKTPSPPKPKTPPPPPRKSR